MIFVCILVMCVNAQDYSYTPDYTVATEIPTLASSDSLPTATPPTVTSPYPTTSNPTATPATAFPTYPTASTTTQPPCSASSTIKATQEIIALAISILLVNLFQ